jgi:hypothetical protein
VVGYNEGFALHYKDKNGKKDVVFIGRKYRPLVQDGLFLVGKNLGNNSAALLLDETTITLAVPIAGPSHQPIPILPDGNPVTQAVAVVAASTDPNCPGEDLSAIVRTHGVALGYKALYENKLSLKLLLLLVVTAVIIIGVVMYIRSQGA